MNQPPASEPLRPPQVRLTDAEWEEMKARHAAEDKRLSSYRGEILVNVGGSRRPYRAGEPIRLGPDHVGSAVTVTADDGTPLAAFSLPEADGDDIELAHPGPPPLTLSMSGNTARVRREVTTADLSLFDNANWLRCHWVVSSILAIAWMIIGAQVTLVETVRGSLQGSTYTDAVNAYLLGTIPGAMLFGWLADRIGRKPVYTITAIIYIATALATALSSADPVGVLAFRFLVGLAIGGEYVALSTTVQEFMPKKRRGWACLAINGTFWLGILLANLIAPASIAPGADWETFFLVIGVLGVVLLVLRLFLPESPRWLIAHYRQDRRTERMLEEIRGNLRNRSEQSTMDAHRVLVPAQVPGWSFVSIMWNEYRKQTLVCLALICAQAFFYNAFYFRYGIILEGIYHNSVADPLHSVLIAIANLAGPISLGWFFDEVGRKRMISVTYMVSGFLLLAVAVFMLQGGLPSNPLHMTVAWAMIFFFVSAAASSAYLTMGESFPVEIRASAFAALFGVGMLSGVGGSVLYDVLYDALIHGWLIGDEQRSHIITLNVFCLASALAMIGAALAEWIFGMEYAGRPLEELAPSLFQVEVRQHQVPAAI